MDRKQIVSDFRDEAKVLNQVADLLDGDAAPTIQNTTSAPGKRHMSQAARARISRAQKARWATARRGKKKF